MHAVDFGPSIKGYVVLIQTAKQTLFIQQSSSQTAALLQTNFPIGASLCRQAGHLHAVQNSMPCRQNLTLHMIDMTNTISTTIIVILLREVSTQLVQLQAPSLVVSNLRRHIHTAVVLMHQLVVDLRSPVSLLRLKKVQIFSAPGQLVRRLLSRSTSPYLHQQLPQPRTMPLDLPIRLDPIRDAGG